MQNKIKKKVITAICLLLLFSFAHADGPPVREDGTITTENISFKINDDQIKEVEKTHIIKLTASQHALLKKHYKKMPKSFVVVTPHYNDCTCELVYVIWSKTDTIVLPLNSVDYFKELLEDKEYPYDYRDLLKNWNKQKIIIDTKGNCYFEGKKLSREGMENVFAKLAKEKDKANHWIAISLPPYQKTEYESIVAESIRNIKTIADKYKINAQIGG